MFDHKQDYILADEVAELTPLQPAHLEALYPVSDDPEIWSLMTDEGYGRENWEVYIQQALEKHASGSQYIFAIKDLRSNAWAGMTRLYSLSNKLQNARIGHTWLGPAFQGTGLNKHAKYLLFEFLFDQMGMRRIGFGISEENTRALHAIESVGCLREGALRGYMPAGEQRKDIILHSILKEDWDGDVKAVLASKLTKAVSQ